MCTNCEAFRYCCSFLEQCGCREGIFLLWVKKNAKFMDLWSSCRMRTVEILGFCSFIYWVWICVKNIMWHEGVEEGELMLICESMKTVQTVAIYRCRFNIKAQLFSFNFNYIAFPKLEIFDFSRLSPNGRKFYGSNEKQFSCGWVVKFDGQIQEIKRTFHANNSYLMLSNCWNYSNLPTHSRLDTNQQQSLLITRRKSSNNIWRQRRFDGIKWKTIKCILFYDSSLRLPIILVLPFGRQISRREACYTIVEILLLIRVVILYLWGWTLCAISSIRQLFDIREINENPDFYIGQSVFPLSFNFHASC